MNIVAETTGCVPSELVDRPVIPDVISYVWVWFVSIRSAISDITFSELESWAIMMRVDVNPWEVDVLMRLNRLNKEANND